MKTHRWSLDSESTGVRIKYHKCVKCGMVRVTEETDRYPLIYYVDTENGSGEKHLRSPGCSEKLVPVPPVIIDSQLKMF